MSARELLDRLEAVKETLGAHCNGVCVCESVHTATACVCVCVFARQRRVWACMVAEREGDRTGYELCLFLTRVGSYVTGLESVRPPSLPPSVLPPTRAVGHHGLGAAHVGLEQRKRHAGVARHAVEEVHTQTSSASESERRM